MSEDKDEGIQPPYSHLAIQTKGGLIPLRKGTIVAIVEDATRVDGIFHLVIDTVDQRQLVFTAFTPDGKGKRKVTFKANWSGKYESWMRQGQRVNSAEDLEELREDDEP